MPFGSRSISVEILGDASQLEREFKRAANSADKFNRDVTSAGKGGTSVLTSLGKSAVVASAGFLSIRGAVGGIKATVNAASDLNEQVNRSRVLFGASANEVRRWSTTTADGIGIASAQALEAAGNFGAMFETSGLAGDEAASMSMRMVQLAADMASFNNEDPSAMLDRIRSGLSGEAEPLRRYGVLLSEARVKQEAYASGLAKSGAALTEQQKVLARYSLILKDTAIQQGDFANTSDNLANVQRRLRAQLSDVAAEIGTTLLPMVTEVATQLNKWLANPENRKAIQDFAADVGHAAEQFGELASAIVNAAQKFKGFVDDVSGFFDRHGLGFLNKGLLEDIKAERQWEEDVANRVLGRAGPLRGAGGGGDFAPRPAPHDLPLGARDDTAQLRDDVKAATENAKLRNRWFDAMINRQLGRVDDQPLQQQLATLKRVAALIEQRIAATKDATRKLTLEDRLMEVVADQKAVRQQMRAEFMDSLQFGLEKAQVTRGIADDVAAYRAINAAINEQIREQGATVDLLRQRFQNEQAILQLQRDQAEARRAAFKEAAERKAAERTARQFRQLGFGPTGADLIPTGRQLLRRLGRIQEDVRGTILDSAENRKLIARIRETLVGGLGKLAPEVRQKVKDLLDALNPEGVAKKKKRKPEDWSAGFMEIGGQRFHADWINDPNFRRAFPGDFNLPLPPALRLPTGKQPAAAKPGLNVGSMVVHIHGVQNVAQFEGELEKRAGQRPKPRRGQ